MWLVSLFWQRRLSVLRRPAVISRFFALLLALTWLATAAPAMRAAPGGTDRLEGLDNLSGGPDARGYSFRDVEADPGIGIAWHDACAAGNRASTGGLLPGDDGWFQIAGPSFPFLYYDVERQAQPLYIGADGYLSFGIAGLGSPDNGPIPSLAAPNDALYPFWDDLDPTNALAIGGISPDICWQEIGAPGSRRLVVQWEDMPFSPKADHSSGLPGSAADGSLHFQLQLLEGGAIRFEYQDPQGCAVSDCLRAYGDSATVGIESPSNLGPTGLSVLFDAPRLERKAGGIIPAILFAPPLADIFAIKTDRIDPVLAGGLAEYRIDFGNNGPGMAAGVRVSDMLPEGFVFAGCDPLPPATHVSCFSPDDRQVILQSLSMNGMPLFEDGGSLAPGAGLAFVILARVSPGYVLDGLTDAERPGRCEIEAERSGHKFWAWDEARIEQIGRDPKPGNNTSSVCTRVEGEADLGVDKRDGSRGPHDPPRDPALCDPVMPGGMLVYEIEVTNHGPSDAAQVKLIDILPPAHVSLRPEQITVVILGGEGRLLEISPDGFVTLLAGRDPARAGDYEGQAQLGRLNVGESVTLRLGLMVPPTAQCGAEILNTAEVKAVAEIDQRAAGIPLWWTAAWQTPSRDPNSANDRDEERTRIECPAIAVDKTVSYDGTCPGSARPSSPPPGSMVTFCIEVRNTGTTHLGPVTLIDRMRTSMGTRVFTDTLPGPDPKRPFAPGESFTHRIMVDPIDEMCGILTNTASVSAQPVGAGGQPHACLAPVRAEDELRIDVPCSGADYRLQLPILDTSNCAVHLQVQNVGKRPATGLLVLWGEPGSCPPQSAGPLKVECTGLLKPGSAWTWTGALLPPGAKSGIVYSMNTTDLVEDPHGNRRSFDKVACAGLFDTIVGDANLWEAFDTAYSAGGRYSVRTGPGVGDRLILDFGLHRGEPLVVSVNRRCPSPDDFRIQLNAAYAGIGTYLEGGMDPSFGHFASYAPLVLGDKAGLSSTIHIHNSGTRCSSLEIWLKTRDECLRSIIADILQVAPGETVSVEVAGAVGANWIGSAWIRASQPLGVVVDTFGPNHFSSYVGVPDQFFDPVKSRYYSTGSQVNYLPLIYSEYQGWDTAIQVQNLSATHQAKVKVYFLDRSGDVITTLVDWVCPRGSQTFFLPVIAGMPGNWIGSARVESQDWWVGGAAPVDAPRIQSVALLEKWADPARSARREAMAYNGLTEQVAYDWQVGKLAGGTQSGSAVIAVPLLAKGNRGITSEIAVANLVAKPGFTDFAIYIHDQNGFLDAICQKLHDRQVEYIDLNAWGYVQPGFMGSAVISATFWEHDVFSGSGRFVRNLVGLGAVVVERIGGVQGGDDVPGDESKAFEGIPIFDFYWPPKVMRCPGQPSFRP